MGRLTVLQALQTILEEEFERVYIYPDEYSPTMDISLPFFVIEELPASENNANFGGLDCAGVSWTIGLYGFEAEREMAAPGPLDAAAKILAYADRDTIRGLLDDNVVISGTVAPIGDENRQYTDMVVPLQWNQKPYMGFYFEIPVTSG